MERLHRFLIVSSLVSLGLSACSMEPREGPPAPIVQVTPRDGQAARPVAPTPQPERAAVPEQPSEPVRRGTQVYAYRDPSMATEPSVPPASGAQPAQPAMPSAPPTSGAPPQAVTQTPGSPQVQPAVPAPGSSGAPAAPPQRPAEPQVAKVDPRAALPAAETPGAERPAAPAPALPPSNFATPSLPPAAAKLAGQAEQQRQAGDFAGAAASLERSLRIAPREAYLWNRLARVRLEQGQAVQAGNLASRANDLAGGKEDIKRDNWRIIAESKRRSGDLAAASEAEQRAGGQ
ncbi:hypothetical protein HW932_08015 [Allochromatium humboldtianum]|uniref:Tetratricopeptide repeat protein n=3 Tax=Allochromatium TaxID=85072 RepID=D3RS91_ALLVD|nr:hypothetical protein [Allochromatium humboldtianum]ADC62050.1 hypothetical protein Alvin_1111 [Allochromatium vinosum DSM 180]NVZ09207.1 hypothetical protein [Allochromatium humboldtianum]